MATDELSLRECPSCHSENVHIEDPRTDYTAVSWNDPVVGETSQVYYHVYVKCHKCLMRGPAECSRLDAAYKWNNLPRGTNK